MRKLSLGILVAAAVILVVNGCDFGITEDDFEFRFEPKVIETIITGYLANGAGYPTSVSAVTFKVGGPSASKVVNYLNEPLNTVVSKGALSFALADGETPGPGKSYEVLVTGKLDGFLPFARRVNITSSGKHFFDMRTVDFTKPPAGFEVVKSEAGQANNNGRVQSKVVLESSGDESTGAKTTVTIDQGVVLKDASGSPLTGKLYTTATRMSPSKMEALSAFPGGYDVMLKSGSGAAQKSGFVAGGFVGLVIQDASGKVAKQADLGGGKITMDVELPSGFTNPVKGQPISTGDRVPIWKLDQETFEWDGLGELPLRDGSGDNLVLKVDLRDYQSQLKTGLRLIALPSEISVGWNWEDTGNLVLNFPGGGPPSSVAGRAEASGVASTFQVSPGPLPGNQYTVPNVACNIPGSMATLTVPGTSIEITGAQDNLCTTMEVNIDAAAACPAKVQFEAYGTCSNDPNTQIRGANIAYFYSDRDVPDSPPRAGGLVNGLVDMCVETGHSYEIVAFVEGEQYELGLTVGGSADEFSLTSGGGYSVKVLDERNPEGFRLVEFTLPGNACGNLGT